MTARHRSRAPLSSAVAVVVATLVATFALAPAAALGAAAPSTPGTTPPGSAAVSVPPAPLGTAPSAPLCTPLRLADARQLVAGELSGRVTQLDQLVGRVNASTTVLPTDKSTLLSDLTGTELPGIQGLQTTVTSATTCPALRQAAHAMVFDYRVYLVMTPQTDLVLANDAVTHAETVLLDLEPEVSKAVAHTRPAQSASAGYRREVSAASGLTAGQSATLLAQTPSGYPTTHLAFTGARANLVQAVRDLRAARGDLATIVRALD